MTASHFCATSGLLGRHFGEIQNFRAVQFKLSETSFSLQAKHQPQECLALRLSLGTVSSNWMADAVYWHCPVTPVSLDTVTLVT